MQRYELYVNQILENIDKIENSLNAETDLEKNSELQDATYMRMQVIGENINKIPENLRKKYPEVKWKKIKNSRDIISHAYAKVNVHIVWDLIEFEIPKLKKVMKKLKEEIKNEK